ncbi:MAG: hypothetical protein OHK005_08090 [Candidatus Methylacidiphilales bacterium]
MGSFLGEVLRWDEWLLRKINGEWISPWADQWFSFSADFGLLVWPFALGLLALLIFGGFRERVFLVLLAAVLLIGDAGLNSWIKRTVNRPRPIQALENVRYVKQNGLFNVAVTLSRPEPGPVVRGRSMTSGHVCNNVAVAMIVTALYAPWGWWIWLWTLSMSYGRIYTGAHYPTDVVASWFLALAYTGAILWGAEWMWQRWGPRWLPTIYEKNSSLFPKFLPSAGARPARQHLER